MINILLKKKLNVFFLTFDCQEWDLKTSGVRGLQSAHGGGEAKKSRW